MRLSPKMRPALVLLLPIILSASFSGVFSPPFARAAYADDHDSGSCKEGDKDCVPFRKVCFNVFCNYVKDGDVPVMPPQTPYSQCHAAAVFTKVVTSNGLEVFDDSEDGQNPRFEVACDGQTVFNNSAHRYTDWQGTRIQAVQGPFPAIVLPRDALRDTHQYVNSQIEFWDQILHGYCFVYTGEQLR